MIAARLTDHLLLLKISVLQGPSDTAVTVGSSVAFTCSSNYQRSAICWGFQSLDGDNKPSKISEIGSCSKTFSSNTTRYIIRPGSGEAASSLLTISSVTTTDAGHYCCWESARREVRSAQLIVVGLCGRVLLLWKPTAPHACINRLRPLSLQPMASRCFLINTFYHPWDSHMTPLVKKCGRSLGMHPLWARSNIT